MDKIQVVSSFEDATAKGLLKKGGAAFGLRRLMSQDAAETALRNLMTLKQSERKDDPERQQGLHGIYEQMFLTEYKRLPDDYYDESGEPWGLRLHESRANILWQLIKGFANRYPAIGSAYLALVLDKTLKLPEYSAELKKLHGKYTEYLEANRDFHRKDMLRLSHSYNGVACPACSMAAALAVTYEEVNKVFVDFFSLNEKDKIEFLEEYQITPLLDLMIPSPEKPQGQAPSLEIVS